MHMDMLAGSFDSSLDKYKPQTHLAVVEGLSLRKVWIAQLWDKYGYKEPQVSPSTYYKDFMRVKIKLANYLLNC